MIKSIHCAKWSKLNWDLSWSKTVKLSALLPEVGATYTIETDAWVAPSKEEVVEILWCPPHSELNGWCDRPYEIEKSFLITGLLKQCEPWNGAFNFTVSALIPLNQAISNIGVSTCMSLPRALNIENWGKWGKHIFSWSYCSERLDFISISGPDETLNAYIEKNGSDVNLVYLSECHDGDGHEYLLRERLDPCQKENIRKVIEASKPIIVEKNDMPADVVEGAKWQ